MGQIIAAILVGLHASGPPAGRRRGTGGASQHGLPHSLARPPFKAARCASKHASRPHNTVALEVAPTASGNCISPGYVLDLPWSSADPRHHEARGLTRTVINDVMLEAQPTSIS